ncbi:Flagellar biosynthesis protein, FliO [Faunimonas pinastri]|uniref:Flagellar biosynthesis protein, FliO n=1 Tax=Faunimonas pinastri TaxID=1855383 RepID=A0A1H9D4H0_9HYPH|nr:flagellar biosynthetic protein FliO [Faunimonas pinastri]SEQ08372.1 Flagellar biosynthesis protein, FliO [Faunimonas pinastri]
MRSFLEALSGQLGSTAVAVIAVVVALVVLALIVMAARRLTGGVSAQPRGKRPRIAVLEAAIVDSKRRLILISRDEVEHLVMIGGPSDVVIESRIGAPVPRENGGYAPRPMQRAPEREAPPRDMSGREVSSREVSGRETPMRDVPDARADADFSAARPGRPSEGENGRNDPAMRRGTPPALSAIAGSAVAPVVPVPSATSQRGVSQLRAEAPTAPAPRSERSIPLAPVPDRAASQPENALGGSGRATGSAPERNGGEARAERQSPLTLPSSRVRDALARRSTAPTASPEAAPEPAVTEPSVVDAPANVENAGETVLAADRRPQPATPSTQPVVAAPLGEDAHNVASSDTPSAPEEHEPRRSGSLGSRFFQRAHQSSAEAGAPSAPDAGVPSRDKGPAAEEPVAQAPTQPEPQPAPKAPSAPERPAPSPGPARTSLLQQLRGGAPAQRAEPAPAQPEPATQAAETETLSQPEHPATPDVEAGRPESAPRADRPQPTPAAGMKTLDDLAARLEAAIAERSANEATRPQVAAPEVSRPAERRAPSVEAPAMGASNATSATAPIVEAPRVAPVQNGDLTAVRPMAPSPAGERSAPAPTVAGRSASAPARAEPQVERPAPSRRDTADSLEEEMARLLGELSTETTRR